VIVPRKGIQQSLVVVNSKFETEWPQRNVRSLSHISGLRQAVKQNDDYEKFGASESGDNPE
jgi:hypothetical protein